MSLTIGSLCSGYGGLDAGVQKLVLDADVAWHSDIDPGASKILAHHWPDVPNLGDMTTVDWSQVEPVDIITAGYPCQPFSHAGKRKGVNDVRHLWPYVADAISLLRPTMVVFENVRGHLSLGFGEVVEDLNQLAYDVRWTLLRASDVGAPHQRSRVFILGEDRFGRQVCGRNYRWGGLHPTGATTPGNVLSDGRSHDVLQGCPAPKGNAAHLRRELDHPEAGRSVEDEGCLLVMALDEQQGGQVHPTDSAVLDYQARARKLGDLVPGEGQFDAAWAGAGRALVGGDAEDRRSCVRPYGCIEQDRPGAQGGSRSGTVRDPRRYGVGVSADVPGTVIGRVQWTLAGGGNGSERYGLPIAELCWRGTCAATDAAHLGHERAGQSWDGWAGPADSGSVATDTTGDGWDEGWPEPAGQLRRLDVAECGGAATPDTDRDALRDEPVGESWSGCAAFAEHDVQWGQYEPAIRRWESVLGRCAPAPAEPGRTGNPRLSPRFVEWMQGLPAGHVTDVPGLSRNEQLKALGNGVVPQQCAAALRMLLNVEEVAA